jgi:hypothetical protein
MNSRHLHGSRQTASPAGGMAHFRELPAVGNYSQKLWKKG